MGTPGSRSPSQLLGSECLKSCPGPDADPCPDTNVDNQVIISICTGMQHVYTSALFEQTTKMFHIWFASLWYYASATHVALLLFMVQLTH